MLGRKRRFCGIFLNNITSLFHGQKATDGSALGLILLNFCLLNLVIIPEMMKIRSKKKKDKKTKGKEALTLFHNFQIFPNLSRRFRAQEMKK